MPGKERRTATKAGRLPPAEKNLAGHLKFMENGRRCQGKRVERKEGRKGEGRGKLARWLVGSLGGWAWSCLVHVALRRLSFSLTILERCNTPYLARSKGGRWARRTTESCRNTESVLRRIHKVYRKILKMYQKTAKNTKIVLKKVLTKELNRAIIPLYRVVVIRYPPRRVVKIM